jgi:hypothetical protein
VSLNAAERRRPPNTCRLEFMVVSRNSMGGEYRALKVVVGETE